MPRICSRASQLLSHRGWRRLFKPGGGLLPHLWGAEGLGVCFPARVLSPRECALGRAFRAPRLFAVLLSAVLEPTGPCWSSQFAPSKCLFSARRCPGIVRGDGNPALRFLQMSISVPRSMCLPRDSPALSAHLTSVDGARAVCLAYSGCLGTQQSQAESVPSWGLHRMGGDRRWPLSATSRMSVTRAGAESQGQEQGPRQAGTV